MNILGCDTLAEAKKRTYFFKIESILYNVFCDPITVAVWMSTPNPRLEGLTPLNLVAAGRGTEVIKLLRKVKPWI